MEPPTLLNHQPFPRRGKISLSTFTFIALTLLSASLLPRTVRAQEATDGDYSLAASLAFVFDITGSMYDDLRQVIIGAEEILDESRKRREKPLKNYVLVPFHDPVIGPVLVTEDADEFERELADLYVQGGGDCPEMSIGAIKTALEVSLPHSFIYVFTDARSKDYYLTHDVLALIQLKQSQVVFVLTGDCGNVTHNGYKAYEEIAATSSGQVFLLKKSQVNQVLTFVRDAVQTRKVNLLSINEQDKGSRFHNLPIDSHLKEITVSLSGMKPRIRLIDPEGKRVTLKNGLTELLDLKNVRIVNVKTPTPGNWRVKVTSSGPHTVRVTGLSHADFVAGFSKRPTRDMASTMLRPIEGIPTNILVNTSGIDFPAGLSEIELIDLRGMTLEKFPLIQDPYTSSLYSVAEFDPPEKFFYVKVSGTDELGYTMQRISHTAISAVKARRPQVFMPDVTRGIHDQTSVLTCQVESLVPYSVQWWHQDRQKGDSRIYSDSANVTLEIQDSNVNDEGFYSCNVTNTAGYNGATTFLDVSEPPPIIIPSLNVSVLPTETAVLRCDVINVNNLAHNVTWKREDSPIWSPNQDPRVSVGEDYSLTIRQASLWDETNYRCIVKNEGGSSETTVYLRLKERPITTINPRQQTFATGNTRNISCTASGHPEPTFSWERDGEVVEQNVRVFFDPSSGLIEFRNLGPGDAGDYRCVASNEAGDDSGLARLSFIEAPIIREIDSKVLVAVGDNAVLKCIADGIPLPNTTWYRADRMLMSAYNVEVNPLGQLIIRGVQDPDAGEYKCVVQNEAGSDEATVTLEVGALPEILQSPENVGMDIETNGTLPCQAIGRPPPKISWRRLDGRPIDFAGRFKQLPSGSLQLTRIHPDDEGVYTCIAQNPFGVADAAAYVTVTGIVRPLIAYTQPYVKVIEGETAELECVVLLGKPTPTLSWLRKGQKLRESSSVFFSEPGRVVISGVQKSDEGDYICMASNIGGNETYTINLDVLVPPRLIINDDVDRQSNFSVIQGRSVFLPCAVEADPGATFTWFKDGQRISLTDVRYYIRSDGALEVFSAEVDDAARYKCVASNVAGEVEKNMQLFVEVGPRISGTQEETLEINVDESVLLPCDVTGTPTPTVTWNKNFLPFDPAASSRLQVQESGLYISRAQIDDKAIYECVASNKAGDANKIITLIVYIPPTLAPAPTNVTVLYGLAATLECEAQGDPPPAVLWKKDGVIIDVNDPERGYYTSVQGSLTIESVGLRDAGRYSCSATNPAGVVTRQLTLSVLGAPQIPGELPDSIEVVEFNPVILACPAEGTPPPQITWFKDGQPVTGAELDLELLGDGALEIKSAQAGDTGDYRCLAENLAGIAERSVAVKVLIPPKLSGTDGPSGPDSVSVIIRQNVSLICPVSPDTDPPPTITWYKDRQPIRDGDRVFSGNQGRSLTITLAEVADASRYNCKAENSAGQVEKYFDLDVQVPPTFDESGVSPFNQSVIAGQTLNINCPIQGKPPPKVTWMKDGLLMSGNVDPNVRSLAEGRRLEIVNARVTDRGRYVCVGENIAGRTQRDFVVNVFVAPTVQGPGIAERPEAIETTTVYMTCPASGIPLPKITWFRQEVPIKQNTTKVSLLDQGWTLEIRDTNSSDAARYYCRAENVAGNTEKVFDLKVLLRPFINRENLDTDISVNINTTAVINCPVSGDPQPDVAWFKNGVPFDATNQPRYEVVSEGRQLRIYNAQLTDVGVYTCAAKSRAGEDAIDYHVKILVPPIIGGIKVNVYPKVLIDSSVVIYCPAQGIPQPIISWFKDGQPLQEKPGRIEVRADGTELMLRNARLEDAGRYECVATNPAGENNQVYTLDVQVTPTISLTGLNTTHDVIENRTVVLDCPAKGAPPPAILWFYKGIPLDESSQGLTISEDGTRLRIASAQVTDAGAYVCVATNEAGEAELDHIVNVLVPPVVDLNAVDPNPRVIKGHTAIINCPVSSIPFPDIIWTKAGQPVVEDDRVQTLNSGLQLRISLAEETDAAQYTCAASNPAGEVKLDFDLVVLVPPSIDESNVVFDRKVNQGRTVQMACPVHGEPVPIVSWLLNGRPVQASDRIRVLENNRVLEIDEVMLTDTARYTCIATNEAGQLERNFDLDVLLRPTIDKDSVQSTIVVLRNKTARFNCRASGTPQPNITWTRHGKPLRSAPHPTIRLLGDGQTLELSNAQISDAGKYTCRATNAAGTDSLEFELKVYVLPTINKDTPDHLHVTQGRSISMRCTARGTPEPKIIWMKDGAILATEDDPRLKLLDEDSTLQLSDAQPEDVARYTCHAENEAGYAEKFFHLDVHEPPKINSTESLIEVPVILNDQVILSCPVTGTPSPTVQWLRKGQTVPSYGMPNIRIQDNGRSLRIITAQLLDFGDYTCVATNEAGEDSLQFRVSIMVPPEIQEGPEDVAEVVNSRALLQCETSGQPTPQVTWTKDGKYFPETGLRHRMLPSGTLELMLVRLEDEGAYTCTASNAAGNTSRTIQLRVQIPAKIVGRRESTVKAAQGKDVMLTCEVEGSPPPTMFWLKYRSYIEPSNRLRLMENGSLHILNLRRRDSAVYTCLAQNNAGTASKNIRLKVEEPPEIFVGQREFSVLQNRTIVLPCQATGNPRPEIRWEKDGTEIPSTRDYRQNYGRIHFITLQTGGLAIPHTRSEDAGTFTCVASNTAGESRMELVLKVQVPPVIERAERQYVVSVGDRVTLPCITSGNPKPRIRWLRNRRRLDSRDPRYRIGQDGSLFIDNIRPDDTGSYICTAENNVGSDAQSRLLRVQVPPVFVTKPTDKELTINSNFQLTCVARGIPSPAITWTLNGKAVAAAPSRNGVSTLTIRSAMKEDAGEYTCVATNPANEQSVTASARVIIKVPPRVIVPPGDWAVKIAEKVVLNCTVRGDPPPQIIWTKNSRPIQLNDRIQKLPNGSLVIYDLTSSDAGKYKCIAINDAGTSEAQSVLTVKTEPKFTIEPVAALVQLGESVLFDCMAEGVPTPTMYWWKGTEKLDTGGGRVAVLANNSLRIVATQQSDVGLYRCFATNPLGKTFVEAQLDVVVNGGYSDWNSWSSCSASCGRGERVRARSCDNPAPGNGGRDCVGSSTEYATCTLEPCPVHGNWSPWGAWSDCSLTCGGGQRRRFRSCSNPPPSGTGQPCPGQGEETETCSDQGCPVNGRFSDWSTWSECSKTCGQAVKERYRECIQPSHGGRRCRGDTVEVMDCILDPCSTVPVKAEGNLIGYINNVDIADGTIVATMTPDDDRVKVVATVSNIPDTAANLLQHLISLLTPVYWTTALEMDGAFNGYSLTQGEFMREVQVEFATGEILKMSHYGNGLDQNGVLLFDIIIRGEVPDLGQMKDVHLAPYMEEYIQTGPGTVYAHSSRLFRVDGAMLPYAWNHTITYDEGMGRMPYLVQQLNTQALDVTIDPLENAVRFQLEATIAPGDPSNRCPQGFTHDLQYSFCRDEDECVTQTPCSHSCHNSPGAFSCSCPIGFLIKSDAKTCQDIDECSTGLIQCGSGMECLNTQGSYRCVTVCSKGFEREVGGDRCVDTNECESSPSICEHACQNLVGSYRCSCLPGFTPGENGRCTDMNECERSGNPCSHNCINIRGSYRCACPPGYRLLNGRHCRDINECYEGHSCRSDQECVNNEGSYHCVELCPPGFKRTESGRCRDVDECSTRQHRCYYNQRCVNTEGGYRCKCPNGYTSRGLGQPCIDIDECRQRARSPCKHGCLNTIGGFQCLCPRGHLLLADRKSCADRDECQDRRGICQHNCTNTRGSYRCSCPPGYRLGVDGFSCHDIDECLEENINCGAEKMCFNHRGSYSCIDIPCPPDYARDPTTNFCVLECVSTDIPCPPGAKYADIIEFRTVALPGGQPARQDLIRLSAYNQHDDFLPQTVFVILKNDPKLEFLLRPEGGKGIVFTLSPLQDDSTYQITVRARSYDNARRHIQYQTTFIIYISVSAFPF